MDSHLWKHGRTGLVILQVGHLTKFLTLQLKPWQKPRETEKCSQLPCLYTTLLTTCLATTLYQEFCELEHGCGGLFTTAEIKQEAEQQGPISNEEIQHQELWWIKRAQNSAHQQPNFQADKLQ